jgi:hypothetical protein
VFQRVPANISDVKVLLRWVGSRRNMAAQIILSQMMFIVSVGLKENVEGPGYDGPLLGEAEGNHEKLSFF